MLVEDADDKFAVCNSFLAGMEVNAILVGREFRMPLAIDILAIQDDFPLLPRGPILLRLWTLWAHLHTAPSLHFPGRLVGFASVFIEYGPKVVVERR